MGCAALGLAGQARQPHPPVQPASPAALNLEGQCR
jgi:hypothetical protein